MTFKEAKKLKESIGNEYTNNDFPIPYKVFVVPKNKDDLEKYALDYGAPSFRLSVTDDTSLIYSRDQQFGVAGLVFIGGITTYKLFST